MTNADRAAVDALARHLAWQDGGFYAHLSDREQATYRAKALDVVQVVGPIYQAPPVLGSPVHRLAVLALQSEDRDLREAGTVALNPFPRPMSKEHDR